MSVTIVNQFMVRVVAKDPEVVVRKLIGFHGMSESVDIQKALQDFVPLVHEEINKQELDINARREVSDQSCVRCSIILVKNAKFPDAEELDTWGYEVHVVRFEKLK